MAKPKYQFPEDPYWKFKSDLARELTAKHFPIRCGHKKDKKVYRTPAFYACSTYDSTYPYAEVQDDNIWIRTYYGSGDGVEIWIDDENNKVYQGPTWTVTRFNSGEKHFKEGVTRAELADTIIAAFKEYFPGTDWEGIFDEAIAKLGDWIEKNNEQIAERESWINGEDKNHEWYDRDWQLKRYQQQINKWTKENKEYMKALEEPALPPLEDTVARVTKKFYLGTMRAYDDGRTAYWWTTAFDAKAAKRKLNARNWLFSRRDYMGITREPRYLLNSAQLTKEFNTQEEIEAYVKANNILPLDLDM